MINHIHAALASVLLTLLVGSLGAATEISLTGRKDLVLSREARVTVLDVAGRHLSDKGDSFLTQSEDAESPFAFEQPVEVVVVRGDDGVSKPVVEKVINYDDASVLRVVAANFSKQVRGTLARGSTNYLQLKGGNLIKPGATFPVSLPEAKGQSFKVTISSITSTSYTLKLGSEEQTISLSGTNASGSIKLD